MEQNTTVMHRTIKPLRKVLPGIVTGFLRSFFTATWTPFYFTYLNGHFKSSFKNKSVSRKGGFLPWYTYPMIDFLRTRSFTEKVVLEFGGGQSTLYWAQRAKEVITFEDNKEWYEMLKGKIPQNVKLFLVSKESREKCVHDIQEILATLSITQYDIAVIDGLFREQMIDIADKFVKPDGAIICDNAEGYGFYEGFLDRQYKRVDFFGHAPGVMFPHCTALYFKDNSFLFNPDWKIPTRDL